MPKYRKLPVEIYAWQLTMDNIAFVATWCGGKVNQQPKPSDITDVWTFLDIPTLEGTMRGEIGDYIIKGVKGEFYPCKGDIFEATYEPVP